MFSLHGNTQAGAGGLWHEHNRTIVEISVHFPSLFPLFPSVTKSKKRALCAELLCAHGRN
jgi:hypothetical protein